MNWGKSNSRRLENVCWSVADSNLRITAITSLMQHRGAIWVVLSATSTEMNGILWGVIRTPHQNGAINGELP
jgi:hypothetical protein